MKYAGTIRLKAYQVRVGSIMILFKQRCSNSKEMKEGIDQIPLSPVPYLVKDVERFECVDGNRYVVFILQKDKSTETSELLRLCKSSEENVIVGLSNKGYNRS